ncbi:hypothetical protein FHS42_006147 [Streptomyces zagrosensis]|uniref:Uncharacterized protein n=1 Tax=Streptomyces zagrosensis TaxID=1042984 RepID=A0A7W9QEZ9_9ACTN|nr:hypothetical protein [Streptomyces zagrosensis]
MLRPPRPAEGGGKVRRRSYKPGWRRLSFRLPLGAGVAETGYLSTRDLDATVQTVQELWENRDQALAVLESGGIGAASVLTVGSAAYMVLTRECWERMREWVGPLHDALHQSLGLAEQTNPCRYFHISKISPDDDAETRIDPPTRLGFSHGVVADLITEKLALQGVTFSCHPEGHKPYVLVKKTRKPPAKAVFKDPKTRELVAKAKKSAPIIGFGAGGTIGGTFPFWQRHRYTRSRLKRGEPGYEIGVDDPDRRRQRYPNRPAAEAELPPTRTASPCHSRGGAPWLTTPRRSGPGRPASPARRVGSAGLSPPRATAPSRLRGGRGRSRRWRRWCRARRRGPRPGWCRSGPRSTAGSRSAPVLRLP